jgi:hypothetical protein
MSDTVESFLDRGLSVYENAKSTIAFFEDEIGKILSATLEQREIWPSIKTRKIPRPKGGNSPGDGFWLLIQIEALSCRNEEIKIECGIWWKQLNQKPIIYGCFHEPKSVRIFPSKKPELSINSFQYWDKTHLYLPITKADEIGNALNKVLDELLNQLK